MKLHKTIVANTIYKILLNHYPSIDRLNTNDTFLKCNFMNELLELLSIMLTTMATKQWWLCVKMHLCDFGFFLKYVFCISLHWIFSPHYVRSWIIQHAVYTNKKQCFFDNAEQINIRIQPLKTSIYIKNSSAVWKLM